MNNITTKSKNGITIELVAQERTEDQDPAYAVLVKGVYFATIVYVEALGWRPAAWFCSLFGNSWEAESPEDLARIIVNAAY